MSPMAQSRCGRTRRRVLHRLRSRATLVIPERRHTEQRNRPATSWGLCRAARRTQRPHTSLVFLVACGMATVWTFRCKLTPVDTSGVWLSCFTFTPRSHFTLTLRWHNFLLYDFRHTSPAGSVYHPDEVWIILQQEQYRAVPTFASRGLPTMAPRIYIAQQMLGNLWKKTVLTGICKVGHVSQQN